MAQFYNKYKQSDYLESLPCNFVSFRIWVQSRVTYDYKSIIRVLLFGYHDVLIYVKAYYFTVLLFCSS